MAFDFGSFAGGMGRGIQSGSELGLRLNESKLKSKMLEHQMKVQEFEQAEKERQAKQLQADTDAYLTAITKPTPAQPAIETEPGDVDIGALQQFPGQPGAPKPTKEPSPAELYTGAAMRQGKFFSPTAENKQQFQHVSPGSMVRNPETGAWEQVGVPKPESPQRPITVAPGGVVLDPKTGQPIFTAPSKPEKPERPITVGPGGTIVDPSTGKPIFTAPPAPSSRGKDIPPKENFKNAKTQLEAMASKYGRKDIAKIKRELESQANQLGYTIQSVRPGALYGWNIDIAPIAPSKRGGGGSDIDNRLNQMFGQ